MASPVEDRRFILMRHAKSSWKTDAATDHERPLNKRGRRDSPRVGARLRELGWIPDAVLSSNSARTTETWQLMKPVLDFSGPVLMLSELYHAGWTEVRSAAAQLGSDVSTVLVLGHNPGWEEVLERMSGEEHELKTACAALLHKPAEDWEQAMARRPRWQLAGIIRPREL